jgi:DNA-binding MarR family transcriptional regulator
VTPDQVDRLEALVLDLGSLTARREGFSRTAAATLGRLRDSGPTRLTELAAAEGVSQPSMSALVARLTDQGLVQRGSDPLDARVDLLSLTPARCPRPTSPPSPTPCPHSPAWPTPCAGPFPSRR